MHRPPARHDGVAALYRRPSPPQEPARSSNDAAVDRDFFISYNSADRTWAEWIAWHLEAAGYTTVLQAWDFVPGSNFVVEMDNAAKQARGEHRLRLDDRTAMLRRSGFCGDLNSGRSPLPIRPSSRRS